MYVSHKNMDHLSKLQTFPDFDFASYLCFEQSIKCVSQKKVTLCIKYIFGPRRDEVTVEWRRLHNDDLYSSPNIVRVIKSRRMRWAENVARMGEERGCIGSCWGNRKETTGET